MTEFIEKRSHKRIATHHQACVHYSEIIRIGTITNCSEGGMYIRTIINLTTAFPLDSTFEVHIPLDNDTIKVLVRAVRIDQSDDFCRGIGVELVTIPKSYLEFLIKRAIGSSL